MDHGLRPEASAELGLVEALCRKLGLSFEVTRVSIPNEGNLQAHAREARHRALQDAAARVGASVVALGHTADDKAETVLLRLLRGAGPRGLSVLPSRSAPPFGPSERAELPSSGRDLVRPIIRARRFDVMAHLARHEIAFADDPSNLDPRFSRVRVRHEVLPLLEELSPRVVEHLCALADMLLAEPLLPTPLSGLGRAQREAISRARGRGERIVKIRVKGAEELAVTFPDGDIVLTEKG